jgi:hypothetical protein
MTEKGCCNPDGEADADDCKTVGASGGRILRMTTRARKHGLLGKQLGRRAERFLGWGQLRLGDHQDLTGPIVLDVRLDPRVDQQLTIRF